MSDAPWKWSWTLKKQGRKNIDGFGIGVEEDSWEYCGQPRKQLDPELSLKEQMTRVKLS